MTLCKQTPAAGVGSGHVLVPQACSRPAPGRETALGVWRGQQHRTLDRTTWADEEEREALPHRERRIPNTSAGSICFQFLKMDGGLWESIPPSPQVPSHFSIPPLIHSFICTQSHTANIQNIPNVGGWLTKQTVLPFGKPQTQNGRHNRAGSIC